MGVPALGAGKAPFVKYETIYFENDRDAYLRRLETFLSAIQLEVPAEAIKRTRRFMYYRYYRFSLPFGEFIESTAPLGYVRLKKFSWRALQESPTARVIQAGLLQDQRFELDV